MERAVLLSLNRFATIPSSLREEPRRNNAASGISVNLARLYHHYYLDAWGIAPPKPDPTNFEYLRFLAPTSDFRIRGSGLGASTGAKRNASTALGQAFCRYLLHDHLNITYFAHMSEVLGGEIHRGFAGARVERTSSGDVPDYVCAENVNEIFLAEAKGRYESISFTSKEFKTWRAQFRRVAIKDAGGKAVATKGFIVGTRFATEKNRASVRTRISAEDPSTPGESAGDGINGLGHVVMRRHYSGIAEKLGQPVLAAALSRGFRVPPEIDFPAMLWEFQTEPIAGRQFVGGIHLSENGPPQIHQENGRITVGPINPLLLGSAQPTFFGLDADIFRHIVELARGRPTQNHIPQLAIPQFYSAISVLRDGSMLSPAPFLAAVGTERFAAD